MASTYTTSLRLDMQGAGDNPTTWGTNLNTNVITLVDTAVAGFLSLAMGDANKTLSTANGSSDQARNLVVRCTGALTANRTITIPAVSKVYVIDNATTGGFSIVVSNGTNSVTIPALSGVLVWTDGTNVYQTYNLLAAGNITGVTINNSVIGGTTAAAGTFTTLTATGAVALSPANLNVVMSPTGTGLVTMAPATAGSIDNMSIGGTTRASGAFTSVNLNNASLSVGGNANIYGQFGNSATTGGMSLAMFNATAGTQAHFDFYRSKSGTVGTATVVASGDGLGSINWYGAQQTGTFATQNPAAQIRAEVDGTVTSGAGADMPGRLVLGTTADAAGTITDRLILDSAGILKPNANDGVALGTLTLGFSDLFGATGFTWNIANSNWVATHSSGIMTVSTGDLRVTNNFTNATSVVTLGGAQTLTSKTLTSPTLTTPVLGTPSSGTLTSCTGLPIAGITGLGTNVSTFLAAIIGTGGYVVDSATVSYATNAALTTTIPADDTIPLITEGTEILSVAISPKTTTNKLRCRFFGQAAESAAVNICAAMFQGSTCIDAAFVSPQLANEASILALEAEFTPGSTSSVTIAVRVGPGTAATVRMNGTSASRIFGGASASFLTVEEIKA